MGLIWTAELSVGNVIIDFDHMNLMRIGNAAISAVEAKDYLELLEELEHLGKWQHTHGIHEEVIAQSVSFPSTLLKSAQQYSQNALRHLKDELECHYGMWSDDTAAYLCHLLKTWVIGHITTVDMPMKPLLQSRDYHFWPGHAAPDHASRLADKCCEHGCGRQSPATN